MLTKLTIRNFKRFDEVEIELGSPVVFVGPNNSGKTTALQALALWHAAIKRSLHRESVVNRMMDIPIALNRRDLTEIPVVDVLYLWRDLSLLNRLEVIVEGIDGLERWQSGASFRYPNPESIECRVFDPGDGNDYDFVPGPIARTRVAYLQPISGVMLNESRLDRGALNVRIGEGRTAEVLRNLCYLVFTGSDGHMRWTRVAQGILDTFGVSLNPPEYSSERGEVNLSYMESDSPHSLDISSAGRGLQQILLLLAFMEVNPNTVILLDEPDAHLEMLRQRQIYRILVDVAGETNSQIVMTTHSEFILQEAGDRDVLVAFVGKPHRIDDRSSRRDQVRKALKEIGFDQYYQAAQRGWVIYLEGSTDLAILAEFAKRLNHPAAHDLERPFVHYVGNDVQRARSHFFGLREAKPDLAGVAIFDRLDREPAADSPLQECQWRRKEIENYLCSRDVLLGWARDNNIDAGLMNAHIGRLEDALLTLRKPSPWSGDLKVTDEFLDPLFEALYASLDLPNLMRKTDYHRLARYVAPDAIDPEVVEKLDAIQQTAQLAGE